MRHTIWVLFIGMVIHIAGCGQSPEAKTNAANEKVAKAVAGAREQLENGDYELARSLAEDAMDIEGATEFDEVQSFLKQLDKKRDAKKAEDVLLSAERAIEQRDVKTAQKFLDEYLKGDHGANKPQPRHSMTPWLRLLPKRTRRACSPN